MISVSGITWITRMTRVATGMTCVTRMTEPTRIFMMTGGTLMSVMSVIT